MRHIHVVSPYTYFYKIALSYPEWLMNYGAFKNITLYTQNQLQSLGWWSLEQRSSDSRLCLFYTIIYGLVAIDILSCVILPSRTFRNSHSIGFHQIQTTVDYYKYSFCPLSIVQWIRLPAQIALLPTFDAFKRAACTVSHQIP